MSLLVIIPCLNEEAHLPALLDRFRADANVARIVVADGGSSDRSIEIVRRASEADPRVVLLHNAKRVQAAGVNLAVAAYGDEAPFFVRVDAHAGYPEGFLATLIAAQAESGADTVTVSMRAAAAGASCFQRAAAAAQNSVLGTGGSAHRAGGERRWVDHGHHALFRTATFRAVGGYDESFSHNEDAELDRRIIQADGKILLAADVLIDYFPRTRAGALWRQYLKFGEGRARTALKHKAPLKPRQAIPVFIAPVVALALLAPVSPFFALPALAWLALCLGYGALLGLRERSPCAAGAGVAAAIMHLAWSVGFLKGFIATPRAALHSPASA